MTIEVPLKIFLGLWLGVSVISYYSPLQLAVDLAIVPTAASTSTVSLLGEDIPVFMLGPLEEN